MLTIKLSKNRTILLNCHKKRANSLTRDRVGKGGLEPPNGFPDRFTVCCNCHYATPP